MGLALKNSSDKFIERRSAFSFHWKRIFSVIEVLDGLSQIIPKDGRKLVTGDSKETLTLYQKLPFKTIICSVILLSFLIIMLLLIPASNTQTGIVNLHRIKLPTVNVQIVSAYSPLSSYSPEQSVNTDDARKEKSEYTTTRETQEKNLHFRYLVEHKKLELYKAQDVQQQVKISSDNKKRLSDHSPTENNLSSKGKSVAVKVLNTVQSKKTVSLDADKNSSLEIKKQKACDNLHKKRKLCVEKTEINACNSERTSTLTCDPRTNKIEVANPSARQEGRRSMLFDAQTNKTIELPTQHISLVDLNIPSVESSERVKDQARNYENNLQNQSRQTQNGNQKITFHPGRLVHNGSSSDSLSRNDNSTILIEKIQSIKPDTSTGNNSSLLSPSMNDELSLVCTPNGIRLVAGNEGSITCNIHNNDKTTHEVHLECLGLERTGLNCYINGTPSTSEILVEASSAKTFLVAAIAPPIPTLVQGHYPFIIRAD